MRFALVFFIVNATVATIFAQSNADLRLVDEIGSPNCDDLMVRLDGFFADVTRASELTGYIVVHGGLDPIENLIALRTVEGHVSFRKVSSARIVVLSTNDQDEFRIRFWKSKDGTKPLLKAAKINAVLPAGKHRVRFTEDTVELDTFEGKETFSVHGCEVCCIRSISNLRMLSDLLQRNPKFDAEFLIKARSRSIYLRVATVLRKDLINHVAVPAIRTKFVFGGPDYQLEEWGKRNVALVSVSLVERR